MDEQLHTEEVLIFNPTKEDFCVLYDRVPYIIPSRQLRRFPGYIARHIAKHLAQKIALAADSKRPYEDRFKEAEGLIFTDL